MGACQMGPPAGLVRKLQSQFGISTFVEAGTYHGDTAHWAAGSFSRVVTIEAAASFAEKARHRFANTQVEVLEGHSAEHLGRLAAELREPALFWLDAHWSGGLTAGQENECPLVEELGLLNASSVDHILLVDDARLFAAPPPLPHDASKWPSLAQVVSTLEQAGRRFVVLVDDIFVAVPMEARKFVVDYWQEELALRPLPPAWVARAKRIAQRLSRSWRKSRRLVSGERPGGSR